LLLVLLDVFVDELPEFKGIDAFGEGNEVGSGDEFVTAGRTS
jgi:hypothetical protein